MAMMTTISWTRATERSVPSSMTHYPWRPQLTCSKSLAAPSRPLRRWLSCAAIALVAALASAGSERAYAQSSDAEAGAQQLFNQARKLMKAKKYEEACAKFEASENLDPAPGTTVNLAVCYEKVGRLATAWSRFRKAADLDKRAGNRKRARFSRKRAARLEKRLPSLIINVADSSLDGYEVMRNGEVVDVNLYGESVYVDPGEHKVVARADGYKPHAVEITAAEGEGSEIEIPELELIPVKKKDPEPIEEKPEVDITNATTTGQKDTGSGRRTTGLLMTSVGVVGLGVGIGIGFTAKSNWDSAFEDGLCDETNLQCDPEGQVRTNTARQRALISNIVTGVGAVLTVAGAIIWLTAPKKRESVSVTPVVGSEQWGLAISGSF